MAVITICGSCGGTGLTFDEAADDWVDEPCPACSEQELPRSEIVFRPRELEIAKLVASGYTNSQIAVELFLGIDTVKTHLRTAMRRGGFTRREELGYYVTSHLC